MITMEQVRKDLVRYAEGLEGIAVQVRGQAGCLDPDLNEDARVMRLVLRAALGAIDAALGEDE